MNAKVILLCVSFFLIKSAQGEEARFRVVETGKGQFATLTGRIAFEGEKPNPRVFQPAKDEEVCGHQEHRIEDVRLSKEGALLDGVIEIKGVEGPRPWPEHLQGYQLAQTMCRFSPNVVVVPNGATLTIRNDDPVLHNVNTGFFNIAQPIQGQKNDQRIQLDPRRQGKLIRINCNIHDWMEAWLYVPVSSYYALTGEDGRFSIDQIPPGTYTVRVVHPYLGEESFEIPFGQGETIELGSVFSGKQK